MVPRPWTSNGESPRRRRRSRLPPLRDNYVQGAPIKNNPLEKILYFSHGSTDLSQTFRVCRRVFRQHILQISLK